MEISKKNPVNLNIKQVLFSLIVAFLILTVCSKSSFLYPLNDWVDANCFFTTGKAMVHGTVVYRDIFEQKGVLLYVIHAAAYLISNKTFAGVFLFEIAAASLFIYFSIRILNLYGCNKMSYIIAPLFSCVVYSSHAFCQGDSAEEFCLPLLMLGLFIFLKNLKKNRLFSNGELLLLGASAGCIFWIKHTVIGLYFGIAAASAVLILLQKRGKYLLKCLLLGLSGFALVTLPVFAYFAVSGALGDLFKVYFYDNMFLYSENEISSSLIGKLFSTVGKTAYSMYTAMNQNEVLTVLIAVGAVWVAFKTSVKEKISLALIMLSAMSLIYGGGRHYDYYFLPMSVFALFGAIPAGVFLENEAAEKIKINSLACSLCVCSIVLSIFFSFNMSDNTRFMSVKRESLPQYKFSKIMQSRKNPTLLNYGTLDNGFYTVSGIVPNCKYFCGLNVRREEIKREQQEYIKQGKTDFIVTRNEKENFFGYKLVASASAPYKGGKRVYYLYAKNEIKLETEEQINGIRRK